MKDYSARFFKQGLLGRFSYVMVFTALALVASQQVRGQLVQGTIDGNVTDSSQGAVAGANVVAKNQGTNFTRETQTNSVGGYSLPTLPPGTYTVEVWHERFGTSSQSITVGAKEAKTVAFTLKPDTGGD